MKKLFIILAFLLGAGSVFSQALHTVIVENYRFVPDSLTINVGDTVVWKNIQGTHNVNGTQGTFPNNPASFGNAVGSGWTYQFIFTQAGTYQYQCDPHAASMKGIVIVKSTPTNLSKLTQNNIQNLYYSASTGKLHIILSENLSYQNLKVILYNVLGKEVMKFENLNSSNLILDVNKLPSSIYIVNVVNGNDILGIKKVSIY